MAKYGQNVGSVLNTYYPQGKVNKKRLFDIMGGVGATISEAGRNELCARLAAVSSDL